MFPVLFLFPSIPFLLFTKPQRLNQRIMHRLIILLSLPVFILTQEATETPQVPNLSQLFSLLHSETPHPSKANGEAPLTPISRPVNPQNIFDKIFKQTATKTTGGRHEVAYKTPYMEDVRDPEIPETATPKIPPAKIVVLGHMAAEETGDPKLVRPLGSSQEPAYAIVDGEMHEDDEEVVKPELKTSKEVYRQMLGEIFAQV